jgi:hypothetical protein
VNNRLLELVQEAEQSANLGNAIDVKLMMQNYAELIVKELLNIADEVSSFSDSPEWLICERLGINHDWRRQPDNFWS